MLVIANSMLVTATREKAVESIKTAEIADTAWAYENGKDSKSDKYAKNLGRVPCNQYLIIF